MTWGDNAPTGRNLGSLERGLSANAAPYNAVGNGVADDTAALTAALTAASTTVGAIYLRPGSYLITSPLPFIANIVGSNPDLTQIFCNSSFSGNMLIDCFPGYALSASSLRIEKIRLNVGLRPVNAVSSSNADYRGPGSPVFNQVTFANGPAGTYMVYSDLLDASGPGCLTGATFFDCHWGGAQWMFAGVNSDDMLLINNRWQQVPGWPGATNDPLSFRGTNTRMIDSYMYVTASAKVATDKPIITVGSDMIEIDGLFIENDSAAGTNWTHVVYQLNPHANCRVKRAQWGLVNNTGLKAFARANSAPSSSSSNSMTVEDVSVKPGQMVPLVFEVLDTANSNAQAGVSLRFQGVDDVAALVGYAAGSQTSFVTPTNLIGDYADTIYGHQVNPHRGVAYLTPLPQAALGQRETDTSTVSGASPVSQTVTLPGDGAWLVEILAALDGHYDNGLAGTWLVYAFNSSIGHNIRVSQQLGVSQPSNGTLVPATLTLSNPSAANVLTVTVGWTGGGSHGAVIIATFTKLGGAGYLLN